MLVARRTFGFAVVVGVLYALVLPRLSQRHDTEEIPPDIEGRSPTHPRLISLAPSITEILFELEAEQHLVGRTDFCLWPPNAIQIPSIGGLGTPNPESMLALKPDWALATPLTRAPAIRRLERIGVPVRTLSFEGIEGIFEGFTQLGALVGKTEEANEWVSDVKRQLGERTERSSLLEREAPTALILLGDEGLYAAGPGSFPSDALAYAGALNITEELDTPWPKLNAEALLLWDPDWIIVASDTPTAAGVEGLQPSTWGREHPVYAHLSAVENAKVYQALDSCLTVPGPRFVEFTLALRKLLQQSPSSELE